MIPFLKTQTPLRICMWDFSWLTCGHFADLPRRVAEAAERGYNALRVDVFPHFYVEKEHTFGAYGLESRIFASYDFAGLTLSNHAEPIFSLWDDIQWQRTTNLFIETSIFHPSDHSMGHVLLL